MSNNIRELEKLANRQTETVKRRQAREVATMERAHEKYKSELQSAHNQDILELQGHNQIQVNAEAEKKQKVFNEMQNTLNTTKELTEKQLLAIKDQSSKARAEEVNKLAVERDRLQANNELYLQDINHRFKTQTEKINQDGKDRLQRATQAKHEQFSQNESHFSKKLNDQTNEFNVRYQTDTNNYRKIKDEQDNTFKKERMGTNHRQQVEVSKLVESHNKQIKNRDVEFRRGIKDQDLFFEKKYNTTLKNHNDAFRGLEERHEKVVTKMKTDLTAELTGKLKRSDDPFYQFAEMKPQLKLHPTHVEVKVAVPEHAKQDLQISTNNKEVIVSFNRRYDDKNSPAEGVTNKLHKVESYSTRMKVPQMVDGRSIKATYEDGVMTYVIKYV